MPRRHWSLPTDHRHSSSLKQVIVECTKEGWETTNSLEGGIPIRVLPGWKLHSPSPSTCSCKHSRAGHPMEPFEKDGGEARSCLRNKIRFMNNMDIIGSQVMVRAASVNCSNEC